MLSWACAAAAQKRLASRLVQPSPAASRQKRGVCDCALTTPPLFAPTDGQGANTALHLAAEGGHAACLRELLRFGADSAALSADGWSPLQLAALRGHAECLDLLLAAGAGAGLDATTEVRTEGGLLCGSHRHPPCLRTGRDATLTSTSPPAQLPPPSPGRAAACRSCTSPPARATPRASRSWWPRARRRTPGTEPTGRRRCTFRRGRATATACGRCWRPGRTQRPETTRGACRCSGRRGRAEWPASRRCSPPGPGRRLPATCETGPRRDSHFFSQLASLVPSSTQACPLSPCLPFPHPATAEMGRHPASPCPRLRPHPLRPPADGEGIAHRGPRSRATPGRHPPAPPPFFFRPRPLLNTPAARRPGHVASLPGGATKQCPSSVRCCSFPRRGPLH